LAGVIVGARLGEREHRADNARVFTFCLDEADHETLQAGFAALGSIPGDCGDEYRRPPFLTASGDLSHHLSELPAAFTPETVPARPDRQRVGSGSVWEDLAGYCRAMRVGDRIVTAGTTATHGADRVVAPGDAAAQTTYILDKIFGAIRSLGGTPEDVIRTRVYLSDIRAWEGAARAHGQAFSSIKPANTLLAVGALVGDYVVEIEAEAELPRP